jgi:hypothetical protein
MMVTSCNKTGPTANDHHCMDILEEQFRNDLSSMNKVSLVQVSSCSNTGINKEWHLLDL